MHVLSIKAGTVDVTTEQLRAVEDLFTFNEESSRYIGKPGVCWEDVEERIGTVDVLRSL